MFEHMRNKIIYYYSVDHNHIFNFKNTDTINTLPRFGFPLPKSQKSR